MLGKAEGIVREGNKGPAGCTGGYSHSRAQDLGVNIADFESDEGSVGAQLTWTPWYVKGWPVDFTLGADWMNAAVNNGPAAVQSSADFFLPYVGVVTERVRETYSLLANAQVETNVAGIAGTDREDFAALGRLGADKDFTIARWTVQGTMYLEPLLFCKEWEEGTVWWKANRAHELAGSVRGQAVLGGSRLVPQLLAVVGGSDTVRGYDESFTSADSVVIGSVEYRLHLARQFVKPASLVEAEKGVKQPVVSDPARRGAGDVGLVGRQTKFRMRARPFMARTNACGPPGCGLGWDNAGPLALLGTGSEGPASEWALALCSGVLSMGCTPPDDLKRLARRPCVSVAASSFESVEVPPINRLK